MNFKIGDKIVYSRKFLNSIQDYSAESANRIGTIKDIREYSNVPDFAKIQWDDEPDNWSHDILLSNIWPADKIHLEPR